MDPPSPVHAQALFSGKEKTRGRNEKKANNSPSRKKHAARRTIGHGPDAQKEEVERARLAKSGQGRRSLETGGDERRPSLLGAGMDLQKRGNGKSNGLRPDNMSLA